MEINYKWQNSFVKLNKKIYSADLINSYSIKNIINNFISKKSSVLDFGCGLGQQLCELDTLGYSNLHGVDVSADLIEKNQFRVRENIHCINDGRIPYRDEYFDLLYCQGVLHHIEIEELPKIFCELERSLKKSGICILIEPRNGYIRRVSHIIIFSKLFNFLRKLNEGINSLRECLEAEWKTYKPYLDNENRIPMMLENSGFKIVDKRERLLTRVLIAKKNE
jgi:ubiquinone/menaquinone biosynthesis C-methylase UbiE